jgi:hypothetical protein
MRSSTRSRANLMAAVLVGCGPSSSRAAAALASARHGLAGQRGDVNRRVDREQHVPAEDLAQTRRGRARFSPGATSRSSWSTTRTLTPVRGKPHAVRSTSAPTLDPSALTRPSRGPCAP